jgi:hypothetical protein
VIQGAATQIVAGAILGIVAQAFLVVVIIGYVIPFFGLELLDMRRGRLQPPGAGGAPVRGPPVGGLAGSAIREDIS